MEPAASIIDRLGGPSKISKQIGVHRTRVSNWKRARDAGGTGGIIPQKHIPGLIRMAQHEGVSLTVDDFFAAPHIPANDAAPAPAPQPSEDAA
ncbi:carph-isopro domain-containing protein [Xanthobacter sediminis]